MLRMKPFQTINVPEAFEWDSVPWEYFQPQKEKEEAEAEGEIDEQQLAADVRQFLCLHPDSYSELTIFIQNQESLAEATHYITEARRHFELLNKMRSIVSRSLLCEEMYKNVRLF